MRNNKNIPQSKPESRISKALKQYARVHIGEKTNNIYSIPLPQTPKISENKKSIIQTDQTKKNEYKKNAVKYSGQNLTSNKSFNQNHSFYVSKGGKSEIKKYPQRSSYTYRQPESQKNNNDIHINNTSNMKKKYETTSFEHPGRRKRIYENKSFQGPPKYYRNNPNKYNKSIPSIIKGGLVAQKICNIVIKGDTSNIEKESMNLTNNKRRNRMIEYEVEDSDIKYSNEEEIEEDSMNNNNNEKKGKIKKRNKIKKKNYNPIIEMQKAQSFQQPRDYNIMPKQKNTKQKIVIGVEENTNNISNIKNNFDQEKAPLRTYEGNYKIKYEKNNKNNVTNINEKKEEKKPAQRTRIIIINRSKINHDRNDNKLKETNKSTSNKYPNIINRRNIQQQVQSNKIPSNNIIQSKLDKEAENKLIPMPNTINKERPKSQQRNTNYLKTETDPRNTNQKKEDNQRKKYIITITTSYRRDNQTNKEKKFSSYSHIPIRNPGIKEKEIEKDEIKKITNTININNSSNIIPQIPKKNNTGISYISNKTNITNEIPKSNVNKNMYISKYIKRNVNNEQKNNINNANNINDTNNINIDNKTKDNITNNTNTVYIKSCTNKPTANIYPGSKPENKKEKKPILEPNKSDINDKAENKSLINSRNAGKDMPVEVNKNDIKKPEENNKINDKEIPNQITSVIQNDENKKILDEKIPVENINNNDNILDVKQLEVKQDHKQKQNEEHKQEIKEDIKEEIKQEIKQEIKPETKQEIKKEIKEKPKREEEKAKDEEILMS